MGQSDEVNAYQELTERLKQSIVDYRARAPGSADTLVEAANELSTVYIHAHYYDEAIQICTQTITVIEESFGTSSLRLLPTLKLLTEATQMLNKWADSIIYLTYIESVLRAQFGLSHPDSLSITLNIIKMYSQLGDFEAANEVYRMNEILYDEELMQISNHRSSLLGPPSDRSVEDQALSEPEIALRITEDDNAIVNIRIAMAEMSHIQGTIYRRLYKAFVDERPEWVSTIHSIDTTSDENGEIVKSEDIEVDETKELENIEEEEEEEEDAEESMKSFFEKKENMALVHSKAYDYFRKAISGLKDVLALLRGEELSTRDQIRKVSDTTFKLAQAMQSFAHLRFQIEGSADEETLGLFTGLVEQSRQLDSLQSELMELINDEQSSDEEMQAAKRQKMAILTDLAVSLNNLGSFHTVRDELEQAEKNIRESIQLRHFIRDASDASEDAVSASSASSSVTGEIAVAKSNLAKVLYLRGDESEARKELSEALLMAEKSHGKKHELYKKVKEIVAQTIPPLADVPEIVEETEEVYEHDS